MKRLKVLVCLVTIIVMVSGSGVVYVDALSPHDAVKKYEKEIIASARKTGVWASVTAAQLILESGNPMSKLATKDNNFFGIKWSKKHKRRYPGARPVKYSTKEHYGGGVHTVKAKFTHFPSPADGITEHSIIWWNGYYEPELKILEDLDSSMDEFLREMANGPYATDKNYYSKLKKIIKDNNLEKLDKKAFPDGRKFCGFGNRKVGKYDYPNDKNNDKKTKKVGKVVKKSNGKVSLVVSEEDLVGMYPETFIADYADDIDLPDEGSLSVGEKYSVSLIKNNILEGKEFKVYDTIRVFVVFLGLCVVVYGVFLLVAYIFDRNNNLFDFSLIKVLAFGRLKYVEEGGFSGDRKYIRGGKVVKVAIICLVVGFVIISGSVFYWIIDIIYWFGDIDLF